MQKTIIRAKKDLFNQGKCFTKDKEYEVTKIVKSKAGLMEAHTMNDQNQFHIIGAWWRDFEVVND